MHSALYFGSNDYTKEMKNSGLGLTEFVNDQ